MKYRDSYDWLVPMGAGAGLGLLLIALICWSEISWAHYYVRHACAPTGQTREQFYFIPVYDGKGNLVMMVPMYTLENLYRCDNGEVWH